MRVFISWSGNKSKEVAVALRRWIPDVIQTVEPWMSGLDINAGARWSKEITTELEEIKFGIICLTKQNRSAPWILFEAGALAKSLRDTFVCPYLIDLNPADIPQGPLTQFQAKLANEKETLELISAINKAMKDDVVPEDTLKKRFEKWWPDLESTLKNLPAEQENEETRTVDDKVLEILNLVRELSRRASTETIPSPDADTVRRAHTDTDTNE